jgi:predicted nucleotidyltransferase
MSTLAAIRERKRDAKLAQLRLGARAVVVAHPGSEVWLFGSLARGDWDAYSDVDLLAIAPSKPAADALADALLSAGRADDVVALSHERGRSSKAVATPTGAPSAMTPCALINHDIPSPGLVAPGQQ